jgi:bifunctional enzyme CysN/CysC
VSAPTRRASRPDVVWHAGCLSRAQRWRLTRQRGVTAWLTGLPAAGKSTIAYAAEARLVAAGRTAYVLDGDNLRHGLNIDLGFDRAARAENVRRTAEVAAMLCDAGVVTFVSLVSPYAADRAQARTIHAAAGLSFLEVHVATSASQCERRDPKGLYGRARRGEIKGLTGVDAPYEPPTAPDIVVGDDGDSVAVSVDRMVAAIESCAGGTLLAARGHAESLVAADAFVSNGVSNRSGIPDG